MPVWHHLLRVSKLLGYILNTTREGSAKERQIIIKSALGHDLLEDTNAKEKEIIKVFTHRGLELVNGMTNTLGDYNHSPYIRRVSRDEEAVRLIKLSDLCDNFTGVAYALTLLGEKWTKSFFLPIVMPMYRALKKTKFRRYNKSAKLLFLLIESSINLLDNEMRHLKNKN